VDQPARRPRRFDAGAAGDLQGGRLPCVRHLRPPGDDRAFDRESAPAATEAAERADFRHLPLAKGTIDVALLLLSAHELRSDEARNALFAELRRVLGPGGRVVVAEHMRDWANFLAFGPGVLHFYSRRTWVRCFSRHRFDIHSEFSITPFVHIFVLRRLT
jgi:SAM-dependent methyltransferase